MGESKRAIADAEKRLAEVQFMTLCCRLREAEQAVVMLSLINMAQAIRERPQPKPQGLTSGMGIIENMYAAGFIDDAERKRLALAHLREVYGELPDVPEGER